MPADSKKSGRRKLRASLRPPRPPLGGLLSVAPPPTKKIAPYSVPVDTNTENFPNTETEKYPVPVAVALIEADVNQRRSSLDSLLHGVPPFMAFSFRGFPAPCASIIAHLVCFVNSKKQNNFIYFFFPPCPSGYYLKSPATRTPAQKSNFKTCETVSTRKSLLTKLFIFSSVQFLQHFGAAEKSTPRNALAKKSKIIIII